MENTINGHTQLYALLGSPVGHSGSPAMYNYSFARTGVDAVYLAFDIPLEQIGAGIAAMRTLQVQGFNVTMPDKAAVMEYLDEITPAARLIGACNTVVAAAGRLIGYNTDGIGFTNNLRAHGVEIKQKKLVVLGTGGAATAICAQSALEGAAAVAIFNIKDSFYSNGEQLAARLAQAVPACKVSMNDLGNTAALAAAIKDCDLLVNATKAGMKPLDNISLIDKALLRPELIVADTVYNPKETLLIKEAQAVGCKIALGGIGMLLWQGVAAYKLFTGKEMPWQEVQEKFFS